MATLSKRKLRKTKNKKKKLFLAVLFIAIVLAPLLGELLDQGAVGIFRNFGVFEFDFSYFRCLHELILKPNRLILVLAFYLLFAAWIYFTGGYLSPRIEEVETREVAHGIKIPIAVGDGQYGTARFMTEKEMEEEFAELKYHGKKDADKLRPDAGVIVDYRKKGDTEIIKYLTKDVNVEILAPTRLGKTRRVLLTSTWLNLLAGVSLFLPDVKGEICAYTSPFARELGYDVRIIDYRYPDKSMHFNNLMEIIELLKQNKISDAVDKAWDIVSVLVGEPKGEPIWTDGQCATIAAAILIVAQDAPEPYKNLTNVYYFLAYMCEVDPDTGDMPINAYLQKLPDNHPARGAFQIAKIAPFRTRSSFFTSALATLRLYTSWSVADIAQKSDFRLDDIDGKKVIFYFILPDEKTAYHPLGAIFIKQLYEALVKQALKNGGMLNRKFIFRLDEIGNFPRIPDFGTMLSAGAGRNIFFELVWQDYQQSEAKYRDAYRNIHSNCQLTICLRATDDKTAKELSNRMGNYTVQVSSASASQTDSRGRNTSESYSNSSNMAGRPLLFPSEIGMLNPPDALLLYGGKQAIVNLPDISEYIANEALGMGDREHNKRIFLERLEGRPSREIKEPELWRIWTEYKIGSPQTAQSEQKVSFL